MALEADTRHVATVRLRHGQIEYRLLHVVTFAVLVVSIALSRLMPWHWFSRTERTGLRRSVFCEARATTNKILPMVFMG